jgi:hypothetical protein
MSARAGMRLLGLVLVIAGAFPVFAQPPLNPNLFQVGIYADEAHTVTCVVGEPGATFEQSLWAWVPQELGLAYITIRFRFPTNLDLTSRPLFHELVSDVIFSDYVENTVEWNMLLTECPSGWVRIFRQECALLDGEPSRIGILADDSMMRDCDFVLNDIAVLNELTVNDPGCGLVGVQAVSWGRVKSLYRDGGR